jgi:hypothetical protein
MPTTVTTTESRDIHGTHVLRLGSGIRFVLTEAPTPFVSVLAHHLGEGELAVDFRRREVAHLP